MGLLGAGQVSGTKRAFESAESLRKTRLRGGAWMAEAPEIPETVMMFLQVPSFSRGKAATP